MQKLITPKGIPYLVVLFYVSTVTFCLLLAYRSAGDGRYYAPSGSFSIQLPGEWAAISVSLPDHALSLFPDLFQDPESEQLSLVEAHWTYYEDYPVLVSVRRIPRESTEIYIGKDSGLKEFWEYLENYQLTHPITPAMQNLSDMQPDCTHSNKSALSGLSDLLRLLVPGSYSNPTVTETRYYALGSWFGPYMMHISAAETADSYYILVATGETDFMDISLDELEKALATVMQPEGDQYGLQ